MLMREGRSAQLRWTAHFFSNRSGARTALRPLAVLALIGALSQGGGASALTLEHRAAWRNLPPPMTVTHALEIRAVLLDDWPEAEVGQALQEAARILGQCGIRTARIDLLRVQVPPALRWFDTPRSRELARALDLPRPALFFAAGTRQVPAFDAEAIGRGNSRSRPELADTVWIAPGTRDLGIVVAHELAHVLMDSGEHDNTPGNLMAEYTDPSSTALTAAQCARITATGSRNGLLRPQPR
jgi:hypothetical protein